MVRRGVNNKNKMKTLKKGFTLIELLIVIAILGVLAVVVLVAINPQQQLARTRDAGRISSVTQLGHSLQAYYTARDAEYIDTAVGDWVTQLEDAGELNNMADCPGYQALAGGDPGCGLAGTESATGWCYITDATQANAAVYAPLESDSNNDRCSASGGQTYTVWASAASSGGLMCAPPAATEDGTNFL